MQVIAFNGSARKDGNTAILINKMFEPLNSEGIATEMVQLAGQSIHGCRACGQCAKNKDQRCAFKDDILNECLERMIAADAIVLGSPTYFADVTPEIKALVDRAGYVARANGHLFRRKIGAAVVAQRRAGSMHAFDTLNHFFLISQMIVPGSNYWNIGFGLEKGGVTKDEEGMATMQVLGENMAWLLKKIKQ